MTAQRIVIVAGPTCSGKSALAMELAERLDGVVINADAMQVYRELRVLTARPSETDEARVPHALYGVRSAAEASTAAWWRTAALKVIEGTERRAILCGGTGLYLNALLHGLADVPEPTAEARVEARELLLEIGAAGLFARLLEADPATAMRLQPNDAQRIARAWEVWRSTGRGLAEWQAVAAPGAAAFETRAVLLMPERPELRAAIARRWAGMLTQGAAFEVAALRALGLDPALPAMRAHGVPELCAWMDGHLSLEEAGRRAVLATGQYTKRQATWLKHHSLARNDLVFKIAARWDLHTQLCVENMPAMMDFLSRGD